MGSPSHDVRHRAVGFALDPHHPARPRDEEVPWLDGTGDVPDERHERQLRQRVALAERHGHGRPRGRLVPVQLLLPGGTLDQQAEVPGHHHRLPLRQVALLGLRHVRDVADGEHVPQPADAQVVVHPEVALLVHVLPEDRPAEPAGRHGPARAHEVAVGLQRLPRRRGERPGVRGGRRQVHRLVQQHGDVLGPQPLERLGRRPGAHDLEQPRRAVDDGDALLGALHHDLRRQLHADGPAADDQHRLRRVDPVLVALEHLQPVRPLLRPVARAPRRDHEEVVRHGAADGGEHHGVVQADGGGGDHFGVRQVVGVRDHRALHRRRVHLGAQVGPRDLEVLLRVDEDDVGVVLERLGEEGAGDAAAHDDDAVAGGPQHGAPPDGVLAS
uniref:Uncharacterized protein n=1 Tax=Zea mays TaxID=4577 RepID=B8A0H8_MAIZE|nr:unknown [Zea mays]